MKLGLVGYGAWGRHHANAIVGAPSGQLAAIATSGTEAGIDWPQARIFPDWRGLVDDASIEAVVIAAPNHLHAGIALAALGSGKHVLLEKPMALSAAECDALVALARASGKVLTIGHELRLSTQWGRIGALISEGAIGKPQHVNMELFRFPYRTGTSGWRYDAARVGSWILEETVHHFDLALWWLAASGAPTTIRADALGEPKMPRALDVTLRFADGALASINTTVAGFEHHLAVSVIGEAGSIRALWSAAMDRAETSQASLALFRGRAAPGERGEALAFDKSGEVHELATQAEAAIQGFREGRALVTPEEGRAAVLGCLLAEQSAREGRTLDWPKNAGPV
jgi:myo-inositol 2-dehydrogenase/D-chiro-inositol 1-dehydrogenase